MICLYEARYYCTGRAGSEILRGCRDVLGFHLTDIRFAFYRIRCISRRAGIGLRDAICRSENLAAPHHGIPDHDNNVDPGSSHQVSLCRSREPEIDRSKRQSTGFVDRANALKIRKEEIVVRTPDPVKHSRAWSCNPARYRCGNRRGVKEDADSLEIVRCKRFCDQGRLLVHGLCRSR